MRWVYLSGAVMLCACTLTVDLPTPRTGSEGGGATSSPNDDGEEAGAGGSDAAGGSAVGGNAAGGDGASGHCEPDADATDCIRCAMENCCDAWIACDDTLTCLCWSSCYLDSNAPLSLCSDACGPADAAFDELQICLDPSCNTCL
jgi:hypothetical protein